MTPIFIRIHITAVVGAPEQVMGYFSSIWALATPFRLVSALREGTFTAAAIYLTPV